MKTIPTLLAILLPIAFSGCTRWEPVRTLPPPAEGPVSMPAARVTPRSGMMIVLRRVEITPDSVIGWREGDPDPSGLLRGPGRRVAMPRGEVLLFEPAVPHPWATAGAALSVVLVALGLYALNAVGNSG